MDFWKTQTAMHHSLQSRERERKRERGKEGEGRDLELSLRGEEREEDIGGTGCKSRKS